MFRQNFGKRHYNTFEETHVFHSSGDLSRNTLLLFVGVLFACDTLGPNCHQNAFCFRTLLFCPCCNLSIGICFEVSQSFQVKFWNSLENTHELA